MDKAKIKRIQEKSGAGAEECDTDEPTKSYDLYAARWDFANHMNFYIPACARPAVTVSMGNASMVSRHKRKRDIGDDDTVSVCSASNKFVLLIVSCILLCQRSLTSCIFINLLRHRSPQLHRVWALFGAPIRRTSSTIAGRPLRPLWASLWKWRPRRQ